MVTIYLLKKGRISLVLGVRLSKLLLLPSRGWFLCKIAFITQTDSEHRQTQRIFPAVYSKPVIHYRKSKAHFRKSTEECFTSCSFNTLLIVSFDFILINATFRPQGLEQCQLTCHVISLGVKVHTVMTVGVLALIKEQREESD